MDNTSSMPPTPKQQELQPVDSMDMDAADDNNDLESGGVEVTKRHLERMRESTRAPGKRRKKKKKKKRKAQRRGSGESTKSMVSLSLPTIEEADGESGYSSSDDDSVMSSGSCYSFQCYHVPTKTSHADETNVDRSGDTSDSSSLASNENPAPTSRKWEVGPFVNRQIQLLGELTDKEKWRRSWEYVSERKNWKKIVTSRKFLYSMIAFLLVIIIAVAAGSSGKKGTNAPVVPLTVAPPTKNPIPTRPSPPTPSTATPGPQPQEFVVEGEAQGVALTQAPVQAPVLAPVKAPAQALVRTSLPTMFPTLVPTSTPTGSPTPSPTNQEESPSASGSFYFNVGAANQVYQDEQKREWQPIPAPEGSSTFSTCGEDTVFDNTKDEELYCSEIWMQSPAALDFSIRVPNGNYQVVLHFTEAYAHGPGERVMDISLQNDLVEEDFDIYTTAGGQFRATQWFGSAAVTDSDLIITLSPKIQNAKLNAIEIHPEESKRLPEEYQISTLPPTSPPTLPSTDKDPISSTEQDGPFSLLVNLGSEEPVVVNGREWLPDVGANDYSSGVSKASSECTEEDTGLLQLFCSERWFRGASGDGKLEIPVPPGMYTVRLYFAELFHEESGKRVFNVKVENLVIRRNFDILNQPQFSTTATVSRSTQVVDGALSIDLVPVVGNPTLSAIEVAAV